MLTQERNSIQLLSADEAGHFPVDDHVRFAFISNPLQPENDGETDP